MFMRFFFFRKRIFIIFEEFSFVLARKQRNLVTLQKANSCRAQITNFPIDPFLLNNLGNHKRDLT